MGFNVFGLVVVALGVFLVYGGHKASSATGGSLVPSSWSKNNTVTTTTKTGQKVTHTAPKNPEAM